MSPRSCRGLWVQDRGALSVSEVSHGISHSAPTAQSRRAQEALRTREIPYRACPPCLVWDGHNACVGRRCTSLRRPGLGCAPNAMAPTRNLPLLTPGHRHLTALCWAWRGLTALELLECNSIGIR